MAGRLFDRSPWLLDPRVSYLDHASFGACPEPVLEAQAVWRRRIEGNPAAFLGRELPGHLDEARREVAAFLGADASGLAFVPDGRAAIARVIAARGLRPGDQVLATDHEDPATLAGLRQAVAAAGADLVLARIPFPVPDPGAVVEACLDAVTARTRLAVVGQVTGPTALVLPLAILVRELDRRGVDCLVNGALAPGLVPVDLSALGAAYWASDGHAWLCAPRGSGLLHVRADLREGLGPLDGDRYALRGDEAAAAGDAGLGTAPDPTAWLTIPAAIRFVGGLHEDGWRGVMAANADLARQGARAVAEALEGDLAAPETMLAGMASLPLPGAAATAAAAERLRAALLEEDAIEVHVTRFPAPGAGETSGAAPMLLVRISAHRYNAADEYAGLAERLARRLRNARSPRSLLARLRRG